MTMRAAVAVATVRGAEELRSLPVYPEPEIIVRARSGDETALAELFDTLIPDIYGQTFLATRRQRAAQQITDGVIRRLPSLLRHNRWQSVGELRADLQSIAGAAVVTYQRRTAREVGLKAMHARLRHAVLALTSAAAMIYFGLVAL